jgi:alkylation response protein AidB-like acyl-CoA dehydrogenase
LQGGGAFRPCRRRSAETASEEHDVDFALTPEQAMMREAAQSMVAREIAPVLAANDANRPLPKPALLSIYAALAKLGITAPRIPEDDGGGGLKMLDYGLMFEQLPPVISISLLAHECTIARIWSETTAENRRRFLPDLIAGRKICCTGTTEPDVGSDPRSVRRASSGRR